MKIRTPKLELMNLLQRKVSLIALLICFGSLGVYGQTVQYNGNGEYQFISGFPASDLHFYLFDDGYHSFEENPVHTYKTTSVPASPVLYHTQPYSPDDPDKTVFSGVNEGYVSAGPPVYGFDNQIQIKRSWNMVHDRDNYFLLMFENSTGIDESISGCVEFHFSKFDIEVLESEILDDYNNGWVDNFTPGVSEYPGYTSKFTWTYDNLAPGEQRFVYIPAKCLQDVFSEVTTRGVMKIDKCEDFIPEDGKTDGSNEEIVDGNIYTLESIVSNYPHDPNCIVTNPTCLGYEGAQTVSYKVYFQNDGTDPVEDVEIAIRLSGDLPLENALLVDASHDCVLFWTQDRIIVHYEDIFMAGMGQDNPEPASIEETIGYVELAICFSNDIDFESNQLNCFISNGEITFDDFPPLPISNDLCADDLCEFDPNLISEDCPVSPGIQSFYIYSGAKVTNTNAIESNEEFKIVPSLSSDYINIEGYENQETIDVSIRSSILGLSKNLTIRSSEKIDINDLPKGVYYLSVFDGLKIKTKSFVKL